MGVAEPKKICSKCKREKPYSHFNERAMSGDGLTSQCQDCLYEYKRKALEREWEAMICRNYQMLPETYRAKLKEQNEVCAICQKVDDSGHRLCVDHCDETKINRGLLCHGCNVGMGNLNHDPKLLRAAANYLEKWHPEKSPT